MLGAGLRARYHRWLVRRRPIPDRIWSQALGFSAYAHALGRGERARLRELATLFLRRKRFDGAAGFAPNDTVRAIVALKACVPILNLGLEYYSGWYGIVMYPGDFRVHEEYMDDAGVVHREARELCGESLAQGPVVLSWETIENERDMPDRDLVIHECAHKLDILNGPADGFPPLHSNIAAPQWTATFADAYAQLCRDADAGAVTRLDPYGTTDPAEFFAVASETFFTAPAIVREDFPAVYEALARFYRQDPYKLLRGGP